MYGLTEDQVKKLMSAIPIIHVHGSLGALERGDGLDHRREYLREFTDSWLLGVDELIQVVSEVGGDSEAYRDARAMLRGAARVVFLGFGYHEPNMVRFVALSGVAIVLVTGVLLQIRVDDLGLGVVEATHASQMAILRFEAASERIEAYS